MNPKWTKEEITILKKCVKENPFNIKQSCEKASKTLNRSLSSCIGKWYRVSKEVDRRNKILFSLVGRNKVSYNRKNCKGAEASPFAFWASIVKFFKINK